MLTGSPAGVQSDCALPRTEVRGIVRRSRAIHCAGGSAVMTSRHVGATPSTLLRTGFRSPGAGTGEGIA